jgi:hypothetical protein
MALLFKHAFETRLATKVFGLGVKHLTLDEALIAL